MEMDGHIICHSKRVENIKLKKNVNYKKCLNSLNTNDAYILINIKYKLIKSEEIYQSLVQPL